MLHGFHHVCIARLQLSATLGNHMVLQRDNAATTVWGFATAGATVKTVFNSNNYLATTGSDGIWRQKLPSTPAGGPYSLSFSASTGEVASLTDVLFGDVFLCGGQSNMQFTVTSGGAHVATLLPMRVFFAHECVACSECDS
jgi:sialate O-acetylesterase